MREIDNICKDSQSDIPSQYRLLKECKSGKGLLELARETDDQAKFDKLGFPKIDKMCIRDSLNTDFLKNANLVRAC